MTATTVRHTIRFRLNGEAVTAHVASHETPVEVAARTRAKRKER